MALRDLPAAGPAYRTLFAQGAFGQRSLITAGKLRDAARDRGIDLPLFGGERLLERLDRSGGFSPVGFLLTNSAPETTWLNPNPEDMVWREERNFEPWKRHGWHFADQPDIVNVSERFSPWQLLYLDDALRAHDPLVRLSALSDLDNPAAYVAEQRARASARLATLDEEWRPLIKLLVALQPRLWSYRSQRSTSLYMPDGKSALRRVDQPGLTAMTFDAKGLLATFELSLDDLAQLHWWVADHGQRINPLPRWYRLAEVAPRRITDALRGDALRARDYFDAAHVLRGLYFLVTAKWLPRADELRDYRTESELRRRHLPRADQPGPFRRTDLRDLLVKEGLYPHRVHFFVEGVTEVIVLQRLLRFLGYALPGSGMAVTDMRGVDQAQHHALLFRSATEVAARSVLIADREGTLTKTLRRLRAEGLFRDQANVLLWTKNGRPVDFEEANFTAGEILTSIRVAARKRNPDARLALTVAEVRAERERQTRPKRQPPALTKLALHMAEDRGSRVSKRELAHVLAERLVADIRRSGHLAKAGERRPLLRHLWYWIASERW